MQVELIETVDGFRALRASWNSLFAESVTRTLFQTHAWHEIWLENYLKSGDALSIIVVRRGEKLAGIAPLFLRKQRFNGIPERTLAFIGGQNFASDYCDFLVPPAQSAVIEAIVSFIVKKLPGWTLLDLLNFPAESANYQLLIDAIQQQSSRFMLTKLAEAPTLLLNNLEEVRRLLRKKTVRNKFNYLSKAGNLEFVDLRTYEEMKHYLPAFFEQHIERWKAAGMKSIFSSDENTAFYRAIVERLYPLGWLKFSVLLLDRKPIAFHLGFLHDRRFFYYKTTFSTGIARHSPGLILLKFLLESAIDGGLREFDFTLGEEDYKYRFANHVRDNMRIQIFRRQLSYQFIRARTHLGKLKRSLMKTANASPKD